MKEKRKRKTTVMYEKEIMKRKERAKTCQILFYEESRERY